MIRSSKHSLKFTNKGKLKKYHEFLAEYRRVAQLILDDIWENGYGDFSIQKDQLDLPKYLDFYQFNLQTNFSARLLRCLIDQVRGQIKGVIEQRRKHLYKIIKFQSENKDTSKLLKELDKLKFSKSNLSRINPELSSNCFDIVSNQNSFDYFIRLKSIGKYYAFIKIPIKATKVSNKWQSQGKLLNSLSLSRTNIQLRFEIESHLKVNGIIVGADQGIKDILTLSNGTVTHKVNNDGYSLDKVTQILTRKKKGSKAFKKAQAHRKDLINWSINQLNLSNIKQINLEKIVNLGYKQKRSRYLTHFCNTLVRDKLKRFAEEQEVLVIEQDCTYRSQRCSNCGLVRKANRKGKLYKCKSCSFEIDSDFNAAKNHEIELPEIDWTFRSQRNNLGSGFYWTPQGLFSIDGEELMVSLSKQ